MKRNGRAVGIRCVPAKEKVSPEALKLATTPMLVRM